MLQQFAVAELFAFLMVFCRIGAGIMVLPAFSEAYVSTRQRLMFALAVSLVVSPVIRPDIPKTPDQPSLVAAFIAAEIVIGLMIGGLARILISGAHTAGTIIATQSSLASALVFDLTQAAQSSVMSSLISFTAVLMLFATDMHHMMLRALVESYGLFAPGAFPPLHQFADLAAQSLARAFAIALQISGAHIAVGILLYLAAGVLARLMPTLQVFFIIMSPQIMISFFVLMSIFSGMMLWYTEHFEATFTGFLTPG